MSTIRRLIVPVTASAIVAAAGLSVAACGDLLGGETITGSGELKTETYDFADFAKVDISHAFDAEVTNAEGHSVAVTVDDNIAENLDVRLDGDTLRIGMKGNDSYRDVTMEAAVAMPALSVLKLSGASSATLGAFESDEPLKIELEGASSVDCSDMASGSAVFDLEGASKADCRDVTTGEITVALQGASSVALAGTGGNADVSAKGASKVDMRGLPVTNAKVKLEGASNASIDTSGSLDVDLAGSSDLKYSGEPTLGDIKMSGDSTLERGG